MYPVSWFLVDSIYNLFDNQDKPWYDIRIISGADGKDGCDGSVNGDWGGGNVVVMIMVVVMVVGSDIAGVKQDVKTT